jgi:hypothetical protein
MSTVHFSWPNGRVCIAGESRWLHGNIIHHAVSKKQAGEDHSIHLVLRQQACQFMRRGRHMAGISRSHKGVVKRRDASNETILRQFVEPIERKDDIPVLLKAR